MVRGQVILLSERLEATEPVRPEMWSSGRRAVWPGPPSRNLLHPLKTMVITCSSRIVVPITASGLRGEQPLVKWNNVDKGSRQASSVTLGKGVALGAGRVRPLRNAKVEDCGPLGDAVIRHLSVVAGFLSGSGNIGCVLNCRLRTGADLGNLTV